MGWGKLLGDFAKGYIGERGIEGTMDDLNSLKNGVSKLFGSNEDYDDYDGDAYQQDWNKTVDAIYESYQNENYQEAVNALESFYRDHDEDYDFWYFYWRADIAYAQWLGAALDEVDGHAVELSSQCGMLESKARTWLSRALDNIDEANEEVEREKYRKLSSSIMSDKEDINNFLKENKVWNEINSALDPLKTQQGPQLKKYEDAISKVKSLYHYDQRRYDYHNGLLRVYELLLEASTHNSTLLNELRQKYQQIANDIAAASDGIKKTAGDDQDDINRAANLVDTISELLDKVTDIIEGKASVSVSSATSNTSNHTSNTSVSENEQEYLEEIKACLADDGTISDRERRILNRLRDSLGISEQRAKELEDSLNKGLTDDEKEYLDALKDSLVDGVISNRERRLLDKLRTSLGISEARAKELEKSIV
jgi:uncharacterized protein YukE